MQKKGTLLGALIFIALTNLVKAQSLGGYSNVSFSSLLANIDPSIIILPTVFLIFFSIIFFSLSRLMFKNNRAVAGIVSACISILGIYGLNKAVNINNTITGIGISQDTLMTIFPFAIIALVILFSSIKTKSGRRVGFGWVLFFLGLSIIAITFTNLIYEKGATAIIGGVLALIGLIMGIRRNKKKDRIDTGNPKKRRLEFSGPVKNWERLPKRQPRSREGFLYVTVYPSSAKLIISGVGTRIGSGSYTVKPRRYVIKAKARGYATEVKRVRVSGGQTTRVHFYLRQLSNRTEQRQEERHEQQQEERREEQQEQREGREHRGSWERGTLTREGILSLSIDPPDAIVIVPGFREIRGSGAYRVKSGKYKIKAKKHGYISQIKKARIYMGNTTRVQFHLQPASNASPSNENQQQPRGNQQRRENTETQQEERREEQQEQRKEQKQERLMITSDESSLRNTLKRLTQEYNELQRNDPGNPRLQNIIQDVRSIKAELGRLRHGNIPTAQAKQQVQSEVMDIENHATADINQAAQAEKEDKKSTPNTTQEGEKQRQENINSLIKHYKKLYSDYQKIQAEDPNDHRLKQIYHQLVTRRNDIERLRSQK